MITERPTLTATIPLFGPTIGWLTKLTSNVRIEGVILTIWLIPSPVVKLKGLHSCLAVRSLTVVSCKNQQHNIITNNFDPINNYSRSYTRLWERDLMSNMLCVIKPISENKYKINMQVHSLYGVFGLIWFGWLQPLLNKGQSAMSTHWRPLHRMPQI